MSNPTKVIEIAARLHSDKRAVRRDRATAAQMTGAGNALGALYAAGDGQRYADMHGAIELCHDAVRVHPSRWELRGINVPKAFAKAIAFAQSGEAEAEPVAPPLVECTCMAMTEAVRDPGVMFDTDCPLHSGMPTCRICATPQQFYMTAEKDADGKRSWTCTKCGNLISTFTCA